MTNIVPIKPTSILDLTSEYCMDRGLRVETLDRNGARVLDKASTAEIIGKFVYMLDIHGAIVFPVGDGQHRARVFYKDEPAFPGPLDSLKKKKAKYLSQTGAPNTLFIPNGADLHNSDAPYDLLIVESELSAMRLHQELEDKHFKDGLRVVALSGIHNIHVGSKEYTPLIPALSDVAQLAHCRKLTFVPDSDAEENPILMLGANRFCEAMVKLRPGRSDTINLCFPKPANDGKKKGPDDYLHTMGMDEFLRLLREESRVWENHPYLQIERKWADRLVYVEATDKFFDVEQRIELAPDHADRMMGKEEAQVKDIKSGRKTLVTYNHKRYLRAPIARIARGKRYDPSTPEVYFPIGDLHFVNTFNPADIPPSVKGDVSQILTLLDMLCVDSPTAKGKILTIAAAHAQNPCIHPLFAFLLTGDQGVGKSLFSRLVGESLSKRYHSGKVSLKDTANASWRGHAAKEWAEFDENMNSEWLKDLITSETYMVRALYANPYEENNYTLNMFTSNTLKSRIEEGDRRMVIAGFPKQAIRDVKLLASIYDGLINGKLISYFRHYLLNEVDASGYATMNSWTEAQQDVIEASKSYKSTVKDEVLAELGEFEGLEIICGKHLEVILKTYKVNLLSFVKEYNRFFPKTKKHQVKINGWPYTFRILKNHEKWMEDVDGEEYRKQFDLMAQNLLRESKY